MELRLSQHAKLSPSSSKRWMECPGSAALAAQFESKSSSYADEGTDAHTLGQALIEGHMTEDSAVGVQMPRGNMVTVEMLEAVKVYVDFVGNDIQPDDEWGVEEKLRFNDDVWGTTDYWRYRSAIGNLHVVDYKHGKGVPVEAEANPQGLIYGLMKAKALGNRGVSSVTFTIVQPRAPHSAGPIRSWTVDGTDMIDFEDKLIDAIAATKAPGAPLVPGDWCRWCPAAASCPSLRGRVLDTARTDFAPGLPYDPAKLKEALDSIPLIETWIKATSDFAFQESLEGRTVPGWKLVEKRATRKWANEVEAASALENLVPADELYERSLLSPAKVEKLLGKNGKAALASLVVSQSSGLTLVHESDKRPAAAARATAQEDFGA